MSQTKEKQTQQAHNIKMTSYQRRCDVITSHRRWYDVILTLCAHWENNQPPSFPPGDRNVRHDPPKNKNKRDKTSKSPAICHCATHQNVVVCSKVWQLWTFVPFLINTGMPSSIISVGLIWVQLWFCFAPIFQLCCLTTHGSPNVSTRCFCWVLTFASFINKVYLWFICCP